MQPIFNMFHHGERSGITVRDIATYTTSAFRAMYKLQPSLEGEVRTDNSVLLARYGHFSVAPFFYRSTWKSRSILPYNSQQCFASTRLSSSTISARVGGDHARGSR